jgi:hypothetical protein
MAIKRGKSPTHAKKPTSKSGNERMRRKDERTIKAKSIRKQENLKTMGRLYHNRRN